MGPSDARPVLALQGIRAVHLGTVWAPSVTAHLLGDFGAEVIHIETESRPDIQRTMGATLRGLPFQNARSHCTFRSQLSCSLDMRDPGGLAALKRLIALSDVVIENYPPGSLARYGLDYAGLRSLRPDIILLSLSPAGQSGPMAALRGYGTTISALAGIDSIQGYRGGSPESIYTGITDPVGGTFGAFLVVAAVWHRLETGQGQHVDVAQVELGAALTALRFLDYEVGGERPAPDGNGDPVMSPHGLFPCRPVPPVPTESGTESGTRTEERGEDQWIALAVGTEAEWQALLAEIGDADLAADPCYADRFLRWQHREALEERLAGWTRTQRRDDLVARLQARRVAATPVLSPPEVFQDPHFAGRDNWVRVHHPTIGDELIYGLVPKFSAPIARVTEPAHDIGADTDYVLGELLGLEAPEID
jgi:benzylsuccinate CoA-transferase BbsF subunit